MQKEMENLLREYRKEIEAASGSHIKDVILYGSYARGDYDKNSDIDVMILIDVDGTRMKPYEDKIYDLTYDFNCENGTDIMPIIQNIDCFNYWKKAYMFYKNIEEEGVAI